LQKPAYWISQKRPDEVVRLAQDFVEKQPLLAEMGSVTFMAQVLNHFPGVEGEFDWVRIDPGVNQGIL
jgi:pterin-4a-carbinolamine dehydratase